MQILNMRQALKKVIIQFLKTTTLHGFKYMRSPFYADRIGWVFCCCASACCAGMLCTVLWARFVNTPTLLSLLEQRQGDIWFPSVGVCATPSRVAQLFAQKISIDKYQTKVSLQTMFHSLFRGKPLAESQISFLEQVLAKQRLSLAEALADVTEPCHSLLRVCRVRDRTVPCDSLFRKLVSPTGVCCVATADDLNTASGAELINPRLSLLLQCSGTENSIPNSCEFFTKFPNEAWVSHVGLTTGYLYRVPLIFTAIQDSSREKLVDGTCVSRLDYSMRRCMINCKERKCGCSDPLSANRDDDTIPICSLSQMNCLRNFKLIENSCNCPASCRNLYSQTRMESSRIDENTFDPAYTKANASSVILDIRVRHGASKTFDLMYTQTWWSLLSSLGGVFNMFLGVGLFSALELAFLLAERLPVAFHRSSERPVPAPTPVTPLDVSAVRRTRRIVVSRQE